MKAKDTLLLNNMITQNPNLARRAYFWHVSSHMRHYCVDSCNTDAFLVIHMLSLLEFWYQPFGDSNKVRTD